MRGLLSVLRGRLTYQIWLYSVNQWEGQPHGVQGGEDGGEPGLPNLPASGNSVKVVVGVLERNSRDPNQLDPKQSRQLAPFIFNFHL